MPTNIDFFDIRSRREYSDQPLKRSQMSDSPMEEFKKWFEIAREKNILDVNAFSFATADEKGRPSLRILLMKAFDSNGIYFFTNSKSQKGVEMSVRPHASALFYWSEIDSQIRLSGETRMISKDDWSSYFLKRPKESQIATAISNQSEPIESREVLDKRFSDAMNDATSEEISIPENWNCYLLVPSKAEFWKGRPHRLNDRILYESFGDSWNKTRLQP